MGHRIPKMIAAFVLLFGAALVAQADDQTTDYDSNERLQEFFDALPPALQVRISDYRDRAAEVQEEVAQYNERPRSGLPPSAFKTAQRRRMKIEAQMAALRLQQKEIARAFYDLRAEGWTPPNNSNIIRLLAKELN